MESTLLHSFLKAAKLKRWFGDPLCSPVIREIKLLFDRIYTTKTPDYDCTIPSDELDDVNQHGGSFIGSSPPADLRPLLTKITNKVHLQARLKHHGIIYATSKTHQGNSQIHFYPKGDTSAPPIPGCIKYIFNEGANKTMAIVIQRLLPFEGNNDPFATYDHFPAQLYSSRLSDEIERIQPDWIFCHFAMWCPTADQAVVLSLSRVCYSFACISLILIHIFRTDCHPLFPVLYYHDITCGAICKYYIL
jgi:hypothetical protein